MPRAHPCRNYPCLCSFDELKDWNPSSVDPRQIAKVPLASRAVTSNPGLIIGLDFTGWNYNTRGDGATQGGPVGNLYPFNHWQYALSHITTFTVSSRSRRWCGRMPRIATASRYWA